MVDLILFFITIYLLILHLISKSVSKIYHNLPSHLPSHDLIGSYLSINQPPSLSENEMRDENGGGEEKSYWNNTFQNEIVTNLPSSSTQNSFFPYHHNQKGILSMANKGGDG